MISPKRPKLAAPTGLSELARMSRELDEMLVESARMRAEVERMLARQKEPGE